MLDVLFQRKDNKLSTSVFRKKTHTNQYLHYLSHHPLQHKMGVIRTLTYRANTIVSNEEDKIIEIDKIHTALKACGYKEWMFHVSNKKNNKRKEITNNNDTRRKPSVVLPYISGVSEILARLYCACGVETHYKPQNSLRRALVAPKDKAPKNQKSGVVYHIKCANCEDHYVGETDRPLKSD